jgi:hypothetical protein
LGALIYPLVILDLGTRVKVFGGGERGDGARTAIYCIVYRLKGSKKEINYKSFCTFIINGSALCNLVLLTSSLSFTLVCLVCSGKLLNVEIVFGISFTIFSHLFFPFVVHP